MSPLLLSPTYLLRSLSKHNLYPLPTLSTTLSKSFQKFSLSSTFPSFPFHLPLFALTSPLHPFLTSSRFILFICPRPPLTQKKLRIVTCINRRGEVNGRTEQGGSLPLYQFKCLLTTSCFDLQIYTAKLFAKCLGLQDILTLPFFLFIKFSLVFIFAFIFYQFFLFISN